jgi:hypothetical protein
MDSPSKKKPSAALQVLAVMELPVSPHYEYRRVASCMVAGVRHILNQCSRAEVASCRVAGLVPDCRTFERGPGVGLTKCPFPVLAAL